MSSVSSRSDRSAFSLLQFLSAPLTGAVSDCLGRRPGCCCPWYGCPPGSPLGGSCGLSVAPQWPSVLPGGGVWGGAGLLELSQGVAELLLPRVTGHRSGLWRLQNRAGPQEYCSSLPAPLWAPLAPSDGLCPWPCPGAGQVWPPSYAAWAASKSFAPFLAFQGDRRHQQGERLASAPPSQRPGLTICPAVRMVSGPGALGVGGLWGLVSLLALSTLFSPGSHRGGLSLGLTLGPTPGAFLPPETVPWLALPAISDCYPSGASARRCPHRSGQGGSQTAPRLGHRWGRPSSVPAPGAGKAGVAPFWCPDALESAAPPGTPWFPDPRPRWGSARCRGRAGLSSPPPGPPSGPSVRSPAGAVRLPGVPAAVDLLSPLALLRPRLWRGPRTRLLESVRSGHWRVGLGVPQATLGAACGSGPQPSSLPPRAWQPARPGPGLLSTCSCSRAWSYAQLPGAPALPVQQVGRLEPRRIPTGTRVPGPSPGPGADCAGARGQGPRSPRLPGHVRAAPAGRGCWTARPSQGRTGEDVFHRSHHGHHPGSLCPADPPWQGDRGCEAGMEFPGAGGRRCPRLRRQCGGSQTGCAAHRPSPQLLIPASLFVGWGHTLPILGLGLPPLPWGEACGPSGASG